LKKFDVIVIGAGAAGLMCAITAAQRGRSVLVLERANKIGKKILMSGGGRCNFTNLDISADNYLSANPDFCRSALSRYTQHDFIALVEKHGIPYHEKVAGQLFCDNSSKDIVAMLRKECDAAGVQIETGCDITSVATNDSFDLSSSCGQFQCGKLVVATGGLSVPTLGGSDFGYRLAKQFGHSVLATHAGLVPFAFTDRLGELFASLSGISVRATVRSGKTAFTNDVLFTHRGLSGPAILQFSSYWQTGNEIVMDLLPDAQSDKLLVDMKRAQPKSHVVTALSGLLPKRLASALLDFLWPGIGDKPLADVADQQLRQIVQGLRSWSLKPAGTEGYRTAEVTLGGVDTRELSSKTMESKLQPGLYFIGEVVDVSGHLGGYNFQWAWSSGHAAGEAL